jgi:hypothetical protein
MPGLPAVVSHRRLFLLRTRSPLRTAAGAGSTCSFPATSVSPSDPSFKDLTQALAGLTVGTTGHEHFRSELVPRAGRVRDSRQLVEDGSRRADTINQSRADRRLRTSIAGHSIA